VDRGPLDGTAVLGITPPVLRPVPNTRWSATSAPATVELRRALAFRLNDAAAGLGVGLDRHAGIGEGPGA
jgi:hypothetical protein